MFCSIGGAPAVYISAFVSASFVMTFRDNFQTPLENHSRYFIALTQMIFPNWVLIRFVS